MLAVQVQYWDLQERKRHNHVTERQTDRNLNIAEGNLDVARGELEVHKASQIEIARHNQVVEAQGWANLSEAKRHNLVTESQGALGLDIQRYNADTNRMNAITNQSAVGAQWYNAESSRMTAVNAIWYNQQMIPIREREVTAREQSNINQMTLGFMQHNVQTTQTQVSQQQADIAQQNAYTNAYTAQNNAQYQRDQVNVMWSEQEIKRQQTEINEEYLKLEKSKKRSNDFFNLWRNLNETAKVTQD